MSEFKDILDDDLDDIFFNEDEFADPVVYKPKIGAPVETSGIVTSGDKIAEDRRGNHGNGEIILKRNAVGLPKYGDLIEIDGVEWTIIREIQRDNWVVTLSIRSDLRGHYAK